MKQAFLSILLMFLPLMASSETVEINGIWYNIVSKAEGAEVIKNPNNYAGYSGEIIIPPSVIHDGQTYSVTSIGNEALSWCNLTSIIIPNSVTSIGEGAFRYCSGLTSITIPNSVTTIGNEAFLRSKSLSSIFIGNNVTSIGEGAFRYCSDLTSITIPNSVTAIGDYAFSDCSGLTSITIGNSITSIGSSTFSNCSGLTSISIPNSVTSIGGHSFHGCSSLTSFVIPDNVTTVGEYAFEECSNLRNMIIGKNVTSISYSSLCGCNLESVTILCPSVEFSSLLSKVSAVNNIIIGPNVSKIVDYGVDIHPVSIKVDPNNSVYDSRNNCNAIIETSTGKLISGCENTIIPDDVTSIGRNAFSYCKFSSLDIPNSVTTIESYAFSRSEITSIVIPNSVSILGEEVFGFCSNLASVTIPNSVTSIPTLSFIECSSLASFVIPNSVTSIGEHAFNACKSLLSIKIPKSVTSIGNYVFKDCSSLNSIVVEEGNKYFNSSNNCNAIIENSNKSLKAGCKSTIIPNNVISIAKGAFGGSGLTHVTIPNSVKSIGSYAFQNCSDLAILKIGKGVTTYDQGCFEGCVNLTDVYCFATTAPDISAHNMWGPFARTPIENFILHVPAGSKDSYSAVEPWSQFKEIIEFSAEITESTYDVNNDGCFDIDDINDLRSIILGRDGGMDMDDFTFDTNNDGKVDVTDIVQLIGMINDFQEGRLLDIDEENEGGYVDPTETEQQIMQLPSDEEGAAETVYDEEESLEYDALAQEVINMYDTDDDSDYYGNEVNKTRASDDELAKEAIRLNGKNIFGNQLTIEQQDWDTKRWGNTRYGGFKTFYNTQVKNGRRYLLVVFYYKGGFPNKKTASLRLGQLNSGKVVCKSTIYSNQQYAVLRVCIDDYLQNYGCFNIFPMLITDGSNARNYLNPFLVKSNKIVDSDWRNKYNGYEFGKINGVSVYCNTSTQGWNIGGKNHQCVELCKRYLTDLYKDLNRKYEERNWGHAIEWPYDRENDTKDPGKYLVFANDGRERVREGDLIVWQHGKYGHIGVVISVKPNEISVAHQNGDIGTYASPIGTRMKLENGVIKDIAPGTNRSPIFKSIQYVPYFIRINSDDEHFRPYNASMSASTTNIKYNPTPLGKSVTKTFIIYNSKGMGTLNISSIAAKRGNGFSVDVTKCSIKPGDFQPVNVTFTPSESGEYKDIIMIESDADDNPTWTVHLSGTGIGN